jgi:hypothetical protein
MNKFRLEFNDFSLQFDRDFGQAKRTGWSFSIGGSFVVTLDPSLFRALRLAWKAWRAPK